MARIINLSALALVAAFAFSGCGTSDSGDAAPTPTPPVTPPVATTPLTVPTGLTLTATATSVTASWTATPHAVGYSVYWRKSTSSVSNYLGVKDVASSTLTYTVTGLGSSTGYSIDLVAMGDNSVYSDSPAATASITTPAAAPAAQVIAN